MKTKLLISMACGLALLAVMPAWGQDSNVPATWWRHDPGEAGSWFDPNNWTAGVPNEVLAAIVDNGGTAFLCEKNDGVGAAAHTLTAGGKCGGTVEQRSGGLAVVGDILLGGAGGRPGFYSLADGILSAENVRIASLPGWPDPAGFWQGSTFKQGGGAGAVRGALQVGYADYASPGDDPYVNADASALWRPGALYAMGGGSLSAAWIHVGYGGNDTFSHTGGAVNVARELAIGSRYRWVPDPSGAAARIAFVGTGTYALANGSLGAGSVRVGNQGRGALAQTGGVAEVAGALQVGADRAWWIIDCISPSDGTYDLSGGWLSTGTTEVGVGGVGRFVQSGGSHKVAGVLWVGPDPSWPTGAPDCAWWGPYPQPPHGEYILRGGSVRAGEMQVVSTVAAPTADVVAVPAARFQQLGGDVAVQDGAHVRGGSYELAAGTFSARRLHVGDGNAGGPSAFTQSGGICSITDAVFLGPECPVLDAGQAGTPDPPSIVPGGTLDLRRGSFRAPVVQVGWPLQPWANSAPGNRLVLGGLEAKFTVTDRLVFGASGGLAAARGSTIRMEGADFANYSTNPAALGGLDGVQMVFTAGALTPAVVQWETHEVAGKDLGFVRAGWWNNFQMCTLQVGDGMTVSRLRLVDAFDNQPGFEGPEALYVRRLVMRPGGILDLNGLNLYFLCGKIDPGATILGGRLTQAAAPTWLIPGDTNLDGIVDLQDFGLLKDTFGMTGEWNESDLNGDGIVDLQDFGTLKDHFGYSAALAAVPEPATLLGIFGVVPILSGLKRRPKA